MERAVSAFAAAFGIFYALAFTYNLTPFTYFPALNQWAWGVVPGSDTVGPPMYWYGWLTYCLLVGLAAGAVAMVLPRRGEKVWATLAWVGPVAAMAYLGWEARHWFTYNLVQ
jgi:hypothetical protein